MWLSRVVDVRVVAMVVVLVWSVCSPSLQNGVVISYPNLSAQVESYLDQIDRNFMFPRAIKEETPYIVSLTYTIQKFSEESIA